MTGNLHVPCGGVPILLCGDNHQKPPPGDAFWYRQLVESLPGVVVKSKRGDAGLAVGAYNAQACGIKLLKSARRVELVRLMRAAEVHITAATNHQSASNLLKRVRASAASGFAVHPSAAAHARHEHARATNLSHVSERDEIALRGGRCRRPRVELCARRGALPVTSRDHPRPSVIALP